MDCIRAQGLRVPTPFFGPGIFGRALHSALLATLNPNPSNSTDNMAGKRQRRTEEQMIQDLEARIASIKAKAERKKVKRDPALRHISGAVRSIDKALGESDDAATRQALSEARTTLSACLSLNGVTVASSGKPRGRRSSQGHDAMADQLLNYVMEHPGQRGEQIAAALRTDVGTMRPPMKKLIAANKIKTRGQRRGMTYFPV
jgi:hypothetical protein